MKCNFSVTVFLQQHSSPIISAHDCKLNTISMMPISRIIILLMVNILRVTAYYYENGSMVQFLPSVVLNAVFKRS